MKKQTSFLTYQDAVIKKPYNNSNEWDYDKVEEIYQKNILIDEENKITRKDNKEELAKIKTILAEAGLPMGTEVKRGVSIEGFLHNHFSKYIYDDSSTYKLRYEQIMRAKDEQVKAKADAKSAKIREENARSQDRLIGAMAVKYGLNILSDVHDVIAHLIGLDKYLHLAHYLEKNRSDWNDGYDYAKTGLDGFKPTTDLDRKIYNEISDLAYDNDGDIDGRVFRDCTYNYNYIFGLVENKEVYDDYTKMMEIAS